MLRGQEMERTRAGWGCLAPEEMRLLIGGEGEPGSLVDLLLQPPPLNPFPPSTGPTFPVPTYPC